MRQKLYNEVDEKIQKAKRRLAGKVVAEARAAGFNLKDPAHCAAIHQLANMEYEITLGILEAEDSRPTKRKG